MTVPSLLMEAGADFSPCRTWRYKLWRQWDKEPPVMFLMLNPSTADETKNDPTVERCQRYAEAWGHGGLIVTNLFAYRSTDPAKLKRCDDPIGPDNDTYLLRCAGEASRIVCAWGIHGSLMGRDVEVTRLLRNFGHELHYLKLTAGGAPGHPLYLRKDLEPVKWE